MRVLPTGEAATRLGGFELVLELASGQSTVLLARKTGPHKFSRWVAVRFVGPFLGKESALGDAITSDVERISPVSHPCVLAVHEVGAVAGGRYVVSDYVEGGSLRELLAGGPIPQDVALAIIGDVLSGLEAVHRARDERGRALGVTHGRITPSSIIVGLDGRSRIAELGLHAVPRREDAHEGPSSAAYEAPELVRPGLATPMSDVFSVGMLLYELLAGAAPLVRSESRARTKARLREPLPLLGTSGPKIARELAEVAARALAPDASHRYRSAEAFSAALERAARAATSRDVGALVEARFGTQVEERRRLSREWMQAHAAWLDPSSSGFLGRTREHARRLLHRRRRVVRVGSIAALVLAGALMGAIFWRLSL